MEINNIKTKLNEEKKLLENELSSIGIVDKTGDWEATPEIETSAQEVQDEADMSEKSESYEERSSILGSLENRLSDINKALLKIESGEYGICEICGKKIEEDRLKVNPAARACKDDMEKI